MRKVTVFNHVSVDGYFVDGNGEMSWAHRKEAEQDPEWKEFVEGNAGLGGTLLFGRVTYEMMASYWPTPQARQQEAAIAEGMNKLPKIVFSKKLDKVTWQNTKLVKSDPAGEVKKLKNEPGESLVLMGSGTIITQLARENLIDEYQLVVVPIVLAKGRTMFDGRDKKVDLMLTKTRAFRNGNVLQCYEPVRK
jgi:dihydrofolate reductase